MNGGYLTNAWSLPDGGVFVTGLGFSRLLEVKREGHAMVLKQSENFPTGGILDEETLEFVSTEAGKYTVITENRIIAVTQEQAIDLVVFKVPTMQVCASSKFILAVPLDSTDQLLVYGSSDAKLLITHKTHGEVHSISTCHDADLFAINFWNESSIKIFRASDQSFKQELEIDITAYAPFESLQIAQVLTVNLGDNGDVYLLVGLSNGYLLCFNLYLSLLKSGIKLSAEELAQASVRLCNVFKVGNVYECAKQVDQHKVQVVSDKGLSILN